jgi:hypothetical protein
MERTGLKAGTYGQYMLNGGDMVKVFVERCREKGQVPFISLRLNDVHHATYAGEKSRGLEGWSRFYTEHPEYRIGPNMKNWNDGAHNWAIPEAREHKFAFIREICEQYDIDGFELDFMRFPVYFQLDKTTRQERCQIMTEFVSRVRKLLDRTAKPGQHRWLCARVPVVLAAHDQLGINLPAMVQAGLDMVNASAFFYTEQQNDLAEIRRMVPEATVYLEMTHCTTRGPSRGRGDTYDYRRTTDNQFYTGAHLAYARGADGVSLFNFVYYREHGAYTEERGPFNEPPFHVLKQLGRPEWLAKQPQWYVLTEAWCIRHMAPKNRPIPHNFLAGQTHTINLDMAPTAKQTRSGVLRLMTENIAKGCKWTVKLNDVNLAPIDFVAKPIEHPYNAVLGTSEQYACFACPRSLAKNGNNKITITLDEGPAVTVDYLDLVLP